MNFDPFFIVFLYIMFNFFKIKISDQGKRPCRHIYTHCVFTTFFDNDDMGPQFSKRHVL